MSILDPHLTVIIKPEMVTFADDCRIDAFVKLEGGKGITIGKMVHIASFSHLNIGGGKLTLEDYSSIASGSKIITGSNMIDAQSCSAVVPPDMQRIEQWEVIIGRNAVIFAGAITMCNMGEGAVLAAGAVAIHPIPAFEVWGGIPARKLRDRYPQERMMALDWSAFFSWYAHEHRKAPDYKAVDEVLVLDMRFLDGYALVLLESKAGKKSQTQVPIEMLGVG